MKTKYLLYLALPLVFSCSQETVTDYQDKALAINIPENFPPAVYDFSNNPPTEKGFELGKKLFYDGRLSSDGVIACASCHAQEDAFTHHGHALSEGVNGNIGTRNSPSIQNMAFQDSFMWDGVATHLDMQPLIPFTSPLEMNGDFKKAISMMEADPVYRKLFKQAFKDGKINSENMMKAFGQFMSMAISANSRYDKYKRNEPGGTLSSEELEGYALFTQKCSSCHATDLFTDNTFRNIGLPIKPNVDDMGRYNVTKVESDKYKFRVPSLRNVEKTAPYMHDGRFATLMDAMNHFSNGVTDSPTLDPLLREGGKLGIELTNDEKIKIIAFMKTLTDEQFLTDKRFSEF